MANQGTFSHGNAVVIRLDSICSVTANGIAVKSDAQQLDGWDLELDRTVLTAVKANAACMPLSLRFQPPVDLELSIQQLGRVTTFFTGSGVVKDVAEARITADSYQLILSQSEPGAAKETERMQCLLDLYRKAFAQIAHNSDLTREKEKLEKHLNSKEEEGAALKAKIAELKTQIDELDRRLQKETTASLLKTGMLEERVNQCKELQMGLSGDIRDIMIFQKTNDELFRHTFFDELNDRAKRHRDFMKKAIGYVIEYQDGHDNKILTEIHTNTGVDISAMDKARDQLIDKLQMLQKQFNKEFGTLQKQFNEE